MFNYIGNFDIAEPFDEYIPPTLKLMNLPNIKYPDTKSAFISNATSESYSFGPHPLISVDFKFCSSFSKK